jgi:hypothetical protein
LALPYLLDRQAVAPVERPLQQLRTRLAAPGEHNAEHVDFVLVGPVRSFHV